MTVESIVLLMCLLVLGINFGYLLRRAHRHVRSLLDRDRLVCDEAEVQP